MWSNWFFMSVMPYGVIVMQGLYFGYRQHDCIGPIYRAIRIHVVPCERNNGFTEIRNYGFTERRSVTQEQKAVRIGPGKRMRFGNEVPEGFVVVDFVDFLHDSANFKQAWFALAALEVL